MNRVGDIVNIGQNTKIEQKKVEKLDADERPSTPPHFPSSFFCPT